MVSFSKLVFMYRSPPGGEASEWRTKYKPMSPAGVCPWIELDDGTQISQTLACIVFAADHAGLRPSGAVARAREMEVMATVEEVRCKSCFVCVDRHVPPARQAVCCMVLT